MSSSARVTPEGRLGRVVNIKTGISLAGGGYLIKAVGHMIAGDEVAAAETLQNIHKEDIDKMYGVMGGVMSKLIVAGSLLEVEAAMEARGVIFAAAGDYADESGLRCPTCSSPQPSMHPAAGDGGEVTSMCSDAFHGAVAESGEETPH